MTTTLTSDGLTPPADGSDDPQATLPDDGSALVEKDLLVEDVSIDGMCGVY
jgi:mycofactocin precursor